MRIALPKKKNSIAQSSEVGREFCTETCSENDLTEDEKGKEEYSSSKEEIETTHPNADPRALKMALEEEAEDFSAQEEVEHLPPVNLPVDPAISLKEVKENVLHYERWRFFNGRVLDLDRVQEMIYSYRDEKYFIDLFQYFLSYRDKEVLQLLILFAEEQWGSYVEKMDYLKKLIFEEDSRYLEKSLEDFLGKSFPTEVNNILFDSAQKLKEINRELKERQESVKIDLIYKDYYSLMYEYVSKLLDQMSLQPKHEAEFIPETVLNLILNSSEFSDSSELIASLKSLDTLALLEELKLFYTDRIDRIIGMESRIKFLRAKQEDLQREIQVERKNTIRALDEKLKKVSIEPNQEHRKRLGFLHSENSTVNQGEVWKLRAIEKPLPPLALVVKFLSVLLHLLLQLFSPKVEETTYGYFMHS